MSRPRQPGLYPIILAGGRGTARISQAAKDGASWLATQSLDTQKKLLLQAAKITQPRDLEGSGDGRFYFAALRLSSALPRMLQRETGHGQRIATGDGRNGYRIYFDEQLLIAAARPSGHARIALHAAVEAARRAETAGPALCADTATTAPSVAPHDVAGSAG